MTARAARSAVIAVSLLVCSAALAANASPPAARTYKGRIKMSSSAGIPGIMPPQRDVDLTMTVTRQPNRQIKVVTTGQAGSLGLRLEAHGKITKTTPVAGGGEVLEIDFKGEDYRAAVETGLNEAFKGVRATKGVHVPITDAWGTTTLTLVGGNATLQSTSTVERGNSGGMRGFAVNRLLPQTITTGFHGQLSE